MLDGLDGYKLLWEKLMLAIKCDFESMKAHGVSNAKTVAHLMQRLIFPDSTR